MSSQQKIEPNIKASPNLGTLQGYHSPQLDVDVRLNTNESPYEPPKKFMKQLKKEISKLRFNRYPDREATSLKLAIAEFYTSAGHSISPDNLIVGNGSNEVIQAILLAYCGRAGKVCVFEPTYALHTHISEVVGCEVILGQRNNDFQVGEAAFEAVLAQSPDVVFLCNPNNPTGTLESQEFIQRVAEMSAASNVLLVVDEAYADFSDESMSYPNFDLPIVRVRTFSKSWSLAGLRLGYAIAPEWIASEIQKVILPYNLNSVSQLAGELVLNFFDLQKEQAQKIAKSREVIFDGLSAINERYLAKNEKPIFQLFPSSANFIFFKVLGDVFQNGSNKNGAKNIWEALIQESIMIRYYEKLDNFLRVTVGNEKENTRFLDALEAIINKDSNLNK